MKIQIPTRRILKVGIVNAISLITSCNWNPARANEAAVLGRIRSTQVKVEGLLLLQVAHGVVLPLRAYPVEKPLSSTPLALVGLARMCQVPSAHAVIWSDRRPRRCGPTMYAPRHIP